MMGNEIELKIAGVIDESIVDGPGIRYVVFVQGCPHHCEGCHNPQTHDFSGGQTADIPGILGISAVCPPEKSCVCGQTADIPGILGEIDRDPMISGVTFSGGEPFCQARQLCALADEIKRRKKDLLIYSGYTYEQLTEMAEGDQAVAHLLNTADRLIDGPFLMEQRDLELPFRGSRNQRYIELARSRAAGEVVPVDEQI